MSEHDSIPDEGSSEPSQAAENRAEEARILEALRKAKAAIEDRGGKSQTEVEQLIRHWAGEWPFQRNPEWRSTMTRRIDDRVPENWIELGVLKKDQYLGGEK